MLYDLARSVLFRLSPETAHAVIMNNIDWAVPFGLIKLVTHIPKDDPVTVMGLRFPNAIGLAAGMDKTGSHVSSLGGMGFGHIEVGTITPRPQAGNPKPRCWRVIPAKGVINHMGFNNCGADQAIKNLKMPSGFGAASWVSISANRIPHRFPALSLTTRSAWISSIRLRITWQSTFPARIRRNSRNCRERTSSDLC